MGAPSTAGAERLPAGRGADRDFFRQWLVIDTQQAHERQVLERHLGRGDLRVAGEHAVRRFPVALRQAGPYFFRRGVEGWMLDFAARRRVIGFNHQNQWHFRTTDHPYKFAFPGLVVERHGFPHPRTG